MPCVRFVHWNQTEAKERAQLLQAEGYTVNYEPMNPLELKKLRKKPPDIIVIDLTRLPMQGRDIAISVRYNKATRTVPIVFVGGDPQKLANIKAQLPDATYTAYNRVQIAVKQALTNRQRLQRFLDPYSNSTRTHL